MTPTTYILTDTFNNRVISRHRTIKAAVRASRRFDRAVKRANGESSYIPLSVTASDGADIADAVLDARLELDAERWER